MTYRVVFCWLLPGFAALLVVLLGYTHFATLRIESEFPPVGAFVSTEGVVLHYLRDGEGVPVVMLHGRDGTLQEFTFSIFDRVARKYDAIAFDRPGYGYSESNRADGLSTEVQAKLIHEALRTLGIENPILVGHSYGGAVLLQYLLDYPGEVRGAIILAGVSYVDEPPEGALFKLPNVPVVGPLITRTIALPVGRLLVSGIYDQAFSPATPPAGYVEEIASLYLRPSQFTATAAELATMYESVGRISPRYGEIEVPVTIIFGDSDRMLDWGEDGKRLDQALPDSQFILIKNAGHKVHHTHPKIVMDALDELSGDYVGQ